MHPNPVHSRARLSAGHQRHAWLWSACKSNTEDITLKLACFGVTGCDADEGADSYAPGAGTSLGSGLESVRAWERRPKLDPL